MGISDVFSCSLTVYFDCGTFRDVFSISAVDTTVVEWKILHVLLLDLNSVFAFVIKSF